MRELKDKETLNDIIHGLFNPTEMDFELVGLLEQYLHGYAVRQCGRSLAVEDREDLVQQTLLDAFSHIGTLQNTSYFLTWVTRILHNNIIVFFRKKRLPTCYISQLEGFEPLSEENHTTSLENKEVVTKCMEMLGNEKFKAAVESFYYRGEKTIEFSKQQNIPEGTVKRRLFLARARLRELYGKLV